MLSDDLLARASELPDDLGEHGYGGPPITGRLVHEDLQRAIALCIEFLGTHYVHPNKKGTSSYGLKHAVEQWCRDRGQPAYIPNGAIIAAAILSGVGLRRWTVEDGAPSDWPNAHLLVKCVYRELRLKELQPKEPKVDRRRNGAPTL